MVSRWALGRTTSTKQCCVASEQEGAQRIFFGSPGWQADHRVKVILVIYHVCPYEISQHNEIEIKWWNKKSWLTGSPPWKKQAPWILLVGLNSTSSIPFYAGKPNGSIFPGEHRHPIGSLGPRWTHRESAARALLPALRSDFQVYETYAPVGKPGWILESGSEEVVKIIYNINR